MKTSVYWIYCAIILLAAVLLSGCDKVASPKTDDDETPVLSVGQPCAVMFRKDTLDDRLFGVTVSPATVMVGTFKRATADWVVIEKDGGEFWVPKTVILFVQGGGSIQTQ